MRGSETVGLQADVLNNAHGNIIDNCVDATQLNYANVNFQILKL